MSVAAGLLLAAAALVVLLLLAEWEARQRRRNRRASYRLEAERRAREAARPHGHVDPRFEGWR